MSTQTAVAGGEAAILSRLIERGELPPEAARSILKLDFSDQERARMHELGLRSQSGSLGEAELAELESYRRVGRLLELMHSKARLSLKRAGLRA